MALSFFELNHVDHRIMRKMCTFFTSVNRRQFFKGKCILKGVFENAAFDQEEEPANFLHIFAEEEWIVEIEVVFSVYSILSVMGYQGVFKEEAKEILCGMLITAATALASRTDS